MKCKICFEPFDHSIHKPYSLSLCPHTYCLKCLQSNECQVCPECREPIKGKNINIALLEVIPESSYDKFIFSLFIKVDNSPESKPGTVKYKCTLFRRSSVVN